MPPALAVCRARRQLRGPGGPWRHRVAHLDRGPHLQKAFDDPAFLASLGTDGPAVKAICHYGQFVGSEIAKPSGHYEETNAAGWDLVDDLWAAAVKLFPKK